jgi:hypothetical protein
MWSTQHGGDPRLAFAKVDRKLRIDLCSEPVAKATGAYALAAVDGGWLAAARQEQSVRLLPLGPKGKPRGKPVRYEGRGSLVDLIGLQPGAALVTRARGESNPDLTFVDPTGKAMLAPEPTLHGVGHRGRLFVVPVHGAEAEESPEKGGGSEPSADLLAAWVEAPSRESEGGELNGAHFLYRNGQPFGSGSLQGLSGDEFELSAGARKLRMHTAAGLYRDRLVQGEDVHAQFEGRLPGDGPARPRAGLVEHPALSHHRHAPALGGIVEVGVLGLHLVTGAGSSGAVDPVRPVSPSKDPNVRLFLARVQP